MSTTRRSHLLLWKILWICSINSKSSKYVWFMRNGLHTPVAWTGGLAGSFLSLLFLPERKAFQGWSHCWHHPQKQNIPKVRISTRSLSVIQKNHDVTVFGKSKSDESDGTLAAGPWWRWESASRGSSCLRRSLPAPQEEEDKNPYKPIADTPDYAEKIERRNQLLFLFYAVFFKLKNNFLPLKFSNYINGS